MALTRLNGVNGITGTIPQGNIANASLGAVTALPAAITTGKVLQVVQASPAVAIATTSTTFVATGTKVNITPSSASSKVFVMVTTGLFWVNTTSSTASGGTMTIFRDSTNINPSGGSQMARNYRIGGVSIQNGGMAMSVLDTPNSTSQLTYEAYILSLWNNPTIQWNDSSNDRAVITAMEIAG